MNFGCRCRQKVQLQIIMRNVVPEYMQRPLKLEVLMIVLPFNLHAGGHTLGQHANLRVHQAPYGEERPQQPLRRRALLLPAAAQ